MFIALSLVKSLVWRLFADPWGGKSHPHWPDGIFVPHRLSVRAIAEQLGEPEERVRWQLGRAMGLLDRRDPLGVLSRRAL